MHNTPPESHFICTTPLCHYQARIHVFGWLLLGNISNGGHLRPRCNFIFFVSDTPYEGKNDGTLPPPHLPPRLHVLPNISPTPDANFHLIIVCIYKTAAT
jgi:hypothetical protein